MASAAKEPKLEEQRQLIANAIAEAIADDNKENVPPPPTSPKMPRTIDAAKKKMDDDDGPEESNPFLSQPTTD